MADQLNVAYFAYGSNMDPEQMAERCPGSVPVGACTLKGFKFLINSNGVATIVQNEVKTVIGVLWRISGEHKKTLDYYEGVADNKYFEDTVSIEKINGEITDALVYIANESNPGPPREGYLEKILRGAQYFKLPENYIAELSSWSDGE